MPVTTTPPDPRASSSPPTAASAAVRRRSAPSSSPTSPPRAARSWAPRTARSRSRRSSAGSAQGLAELFSLPDGYEVAARQRRHDRVLGRGDVRPRARARAAPRPTASSREVRRRRPRPRRSSPTRSSSSADPGDAPAPVGRPGRRRRRVGPQRDLDRRHGPGRAPAGADDALVADRRRPPAPAACRVDVGQADVYYFAPQKCFAADGGLWLAPAQPRGDRADRRARRRRRPLAARVPVALRRRSTTRARTRPTTRRRSATLLLLARPGRLDARQRRARLVRRAHDRVVEPPLRLGRAVATSRRRSSPTPRSARWSSARSTSTTRSTRPRVAATLRANGIVDVEPYRKLGRNQLRIGMFPADRAGRRRGADGLHRLGRRERGGGHADEGARQGEDRRLGVELLRDAGFDVELGVDWEDGELEQRIGEFDGILIRSATKLTAGPDRQGRQPEGDRPRRRRSRQRRRRRRDASAGSSSPTRRSRTSSPPPSTRWRCCSRWRATSRRRTPRSSGAPGTARSTAASSCTRRRSASSASAASASSSPSARAASACACSPSTPTSPRSASASSASSGPRASDDVYAEADFITSTCRRRPRPRAGSNAEAFAKMKDGVRVLNVARGPLLVDDDLQAALDSGKVGGAALDVFREEPITDHPLFGYPERRRHAAPRRLDGRGDRPRRLPGGRAGRRCAHRRRGHQRRQRAGGGGRGPRGARPVPAARARTSAGSRPASPTARRSTRSRSSTSAGSPSATRAC